MDETSRERQQPPSTALDFADVRPRNLDLATDDDLHPGTLADCVECQWALARRAEASAQVLERRADLLDGLGEARDSRNLEIWRQTFGR